MMSFLRKLLHNESGNTLILTAAAMPLLIGSAGLATDTIQWALWKRQLQKAADSAAIAGVYARMSGADVTTAVNYDAGYPTFTSNGPNNNRTGLTLLSAPVISTAPTGLPAGSTGGVKVTMQVRQTLPFSSMFMAAAPTITASATAAGVASGDYCVISLESTSTTGISAGGSTQVDLGCGMITDSTSLNAAVAFGSSSVRATPIGAVGGLNTSNNWAPGTTLLPFTLAQPDPYASLPDPVIPSPCNTKLNDKPGDVTTFPATAPTAPVCLSQFTIQGDMTLRPGTYIVTSDFNVNSGAKLSCSSCTFILSNNNANSIPQLKINGGATVDLHAPHDTSSTYNGVLFYQDRRAPNANGNTINGNSSSVYEGSFYFPSQEVQYTGNAGISFDCVRLVSRRVTFSGNSSIGNKCDYGDGDGFKGRHVRLVA